MKNILNDNCLILNRLWQAVNVCSIQRAMALLYIGQADVVKELSKGEFITMGFDDWIEFGNQPENQPENTGDFIHTVNLKILVPKVLLLKFFDRLPHKDVKFTRHNIFERDKNTCQYCGKRFDRAHLNIDHVVPKDAGGATTWENTVCACITCNTRKANRNPTEAGMKLLKKPQRPRWRPFSGTRPFKVMHPEWESHMDFAGWDVEISGHQHK